MTKKISICAGRVLLCLGAHQGPMSLKDISVEIGVPMELLLKTVTWLARYSYVQVHGTDLSSSTISLKANP